jgi:hypothetical protein
MKMAREDGAIGDSSPYEFECGGTLIEGKTNYSANHFSAFFFNTFS